MPDTHDERGGDESAALTVAQYADRYMAYGDGRSDMDPGRPPIEAMWRVRKQLRDLRKQLAAATARAEKAEAEVARLRSLEDSYIVALDQMSIGDVQWLRERAEKAERERDAWRSEAERRSAERNAAVRRIGLVRECLNVPGELLPGLAELLENGTGRALSATETDADGVQASREGSNSSATAAGLSGVEADDDAFLVGHTYRSENGYFEFHCERRIGDIALGIETVLKEWPVQPGQRFRRWASIGPEGCYSDVTNNDTTEDGQHG